MRNIVAFFLIIVGLCVHDAKALACSINLMWVKKSADNNPYLFPENLPKSPEKKTIERISAWQTDNPDCKIYFWYDRKKTNNQQLGKTQKLLKNHNLQNVILKNLWDVKEIKAHESIFSDPVPIYFRVDLLRAVVGDDMINQGEERYVVYADLNIPPMDNKLLFDERTIRVLNKVGIILSKNHAPHAEPYENGFFILDRDNPFIKDLHKRELIDWSLKKGSNFLKDYQQLPNESAKEQMAKDFDLDQHVFHRYKALWNVVWEKYSSTDPSQQGKRASIEQIVKDVDQPISHLSQFN